MIIPPPLPPLPPLPPPGGPEPLQTKSCPSWEQGFWSKASKFMRWYCLKIIRQNQRHESKWAAERSLLGLRKKTCKWKQFCWVDVELVTRLIRGCDNSLLHLYWEHLQPYFSNLITELSSLLRWIPDNATNFLIQLLMVSTQCEICNIICNTGNTLQCNMDNKIDNALHSWSLQFHSKVNGTIKKRLSD